MQFNSAAESSLTEIELRRQSTKNLLRFGIDFLDDATSGISQHDNVLIGAPSGAGKTQLCCNISLANISEGRRVHYIALEAEPYEIERRLKFQLISSAYHQAPQAIRPKLSGPLTYDRWEQGLYIDEMREIEEGVADLFSRGYKDLFLLYKQGRFTVHDLIQQVVENAQNTDLILVDHVHYFDFDDDNENKAVKEIAMKARDLSLEEGKPIILVSHLRKRDRMNNELCAGLDEFHGSSDLYKVATKVITVAPGTVTQSGDFETFMRVPKHRKKGNATRYLGRLKFDPKTNKYRPGYKLGWAGLTSKSGFEELDRDLYPEWAINRGE